MSDHEGERAPGAHAVIQPNFPVPSKMEVKGDVAANWEFFRGQFEDYEIATGLDKRDARVRAATLRSVMGKECLQILKNLNLTNDEQNSVNSCLDQLEAHFKPQKNVIYERFVFNTTSQEIDENFDAFLNKLRKRASTSNFGAMTDEMIRDRIVIGVRDSHLKERMLRIKDLDLNKAVELSKASEIANKQLLSLGKLESKPVEEHINVVKTKTKNARQTKARDPSDTGTPKGKTTRSWSKCFRCGQAKRHQTKDECPAIGQTCRRCKKPNHFAKVCQSAPEKSVKAVEQQSDNDVESDTDDSEEGCYQLQMISSLQTKGKQVHTVIKFCIKYQGEKPFTSQLRCQLDTGATCNVISHRDLTQLLQDGQPPLRRSKVKLKTFDGTFLRPLGETTLQAEHRGKRHTLLFQVLNGTNNPILSAETCETMGLVQFNIDLPQEVNTLQGVQTPITEENVLQEYKDLFKGLGLLGHTTLVTDPEVKPVQHTHRRIPVALQEDVKSKLKDLEDKGIIEKVTQPTEWISSMVVVAKRDKIRICLDPRDLNKAVQRPRYQMPTLEEILPRLSTAKLFTTLDLKDGFYQIALDAESSLKTAFWTPFGRYKYLRLPFGISCAPEEFERKLHEKLDDLPGVIVLRDDILVVGHGTTPEEVERDHDENLKRLLDRAQQENIKLNKDKMKFKRTEVKFMGHMITKDGLKADPDKVKAIKEMPRPHSKQETLTLLGFINYLAKFLPRLADVTQPLRDLTKETTFKWDAPHETAFNSMKELVASQPVLRYYNPDEEVTLQCDASESGLGATLLQQGQPVAFASRTLSPTERAYAQIEKECLAIVFGCQRFHQYLARKDLILVDSDHKPLQSIFRKSILAAPCRLQRMLLRLQRYNIEVRYKPGKEMYVADHLSRAQLTETEDCNDEFQVFALELEEMTPFSSIKVSPERLTQLQMNTAQDPTLQTLKNIVLTGWPDQHKHVPPNIQDYWNYREEISIHNGVLFKNMRIIVPRALRAEMLAKIHSSHLGIESCLRKAKDLVFWPHMHADIKDVVDKCTICAEFQARNAKEPMQTHEIPDRPWSRVASDLFHLYDKDYIVLVDYYSDFIEVEQLEDTTSTTLIQFFKTQFSRHGIPDCLVTDNGPQYVSKEFRHFTQDWEFKHVTASPHHPKSNGKAESAVKVTKRLFKKALKDKKDPWLALLDQRNTPTDPLQSSPAQRLMSRRTRTLIPTATSLLYPNVVDGVKEKQQLRKQRAKFYHDRTAKPLPELEMGQEVRIAPLGQGKPWTTGVCKTQLSDRSYLVQTNSDTLRRNRNMLRPSTSFQAGVTESQVSQREVENHELVTTSAPQPSIQRSSHSQPSIQRSSHSQPSIQRSSNPPSDSRTADKVVHTRTRIVKPPDRYGFSNT